MCISQLQNSAGLLTSDPGEMTSIAVTHFQEAFSSQHHLADSTVLDCIPSLVDQLDTDTLCSIPTAAEIQDLCLQAIPR